MHEFIASDAVALGTIAGAVLLGVMSPGPNFLLVTTTAARSRSGAVAVALGFGIAALFWSSMSIAGLAALLARAGRLYRVVQIAGGAYLFHLGLRMMIRRRAPPGTGVALPPLKPHALMWRGFATNIGNPKSVAFYGSVFAALVPHEAPVEVSASAVMITGLISFTWYVAVGLLFSSLSVQQLYSRLSAVLDRLLGGLMSVLGVAMAAKG